MKFWQVFKYIWPQKSRLAIIFISVFIIALFYSLSFATIVPLLKVVMGEEGLHGWVDRNICKSRYGLSFYVPESADVYTEGTTDVFKQLLIVNVNKKSNAEKAGMKKQDKILNIISGKQDMTEVTAPKLLEAIALAEEGTLKLEVQSLAGPKKELILQVPKKTKYGKWARGFADIFEKDKAKSTKLYTIVMIILAMGVVTIIRCTATFLQKYNSSKVVQTAGYLLRSDVYKHVLDMPIGFFVAQGTSDTVNRMLSDIGFIGQGVKVVLGKALREPAKAIGLLLVAFWLSWKLSLIFLTIAPVAIFIGAGLGKKIKKATKKFLVVSASMLAKVEETVIALKVVKVFNRQKHEKDSFDEVNKTVCKRLIKIAKVDSTAGPVMEVIGMFAGSAALVVGANWVVKSNMGKSEFFGLLIALGAAAESIRKSSDVWNKVQISNAAAERVFGVLDYPLETQNEKAQALAPLKNQIEFENIVFTYPGTEKPVLNGVNLKVKAGENIAIVGPNGSGKTTLMNLLPRFYDADSGSIMIDGTDIKDVTFASLRSQIGMITQSVVTFTDTVAANIAYGKPDATRQQIIDAAKSAFAHEFIEPLKDGYDTLIGEHSAGFSGGQLQRIVIARAILSNPAIMIFDEATSQVDADSEAKIHEALKNVMRQRTSFIIAHRFSTVISADTIVVMDKGRIIAQGQHAQLIKDCPLYQSLYQTQLMGTDQ